MYKTVKGVGRVKGRLVGCVGVSQHALGACGRRRWAVGARWGWARLPWAVFGPPRPPG